MNKKIIYIVTVNILILILITLFFDQQKIENKKENSLFMNSILKSYKMELSLHRNLIGYKFSNLDSFIAKASKHRGIDKHKLIYLQLDLKDDKFDYEKTIITALDYYVELKNTSDFFKNIELFLIQKRNFTSLERYVSENYINEISVIKDSTNYFTKDFNFPKRGAIVMLLSSHNICQYAYYLEKNNERKVFENSTVILNLLKNRYE